jgi:hypothetical protein
MDKPEFDRDHVAQTGSSAIQPDIRLNVKWFDAKLIGK